MRRKVWLAGICLFVVLLIWLIWESVSLQVTKYQVSSENLPKAFDGYRIVQVSDFHNHRYGADNAGLLEEIKKLRPDIIAVTGDVITNSRDLKTDNTPNFLRRLTAIAPVYYVPGNHEAWTSEYPRLERQMRDAGIHVLRNEKVVLQKGTDTIELLGVDDPAFAEESFADDAAAMDAALQKLCDGSHCRILLSHRPELFDQYAAHNIDLVFSGHAHGGQFRLPGIGGLYAPNQGIFPKYSGGLYRKGNTQMVVSRGLGNGFFPIRIGNRLELVFVTLHTENGR